MSEIPHWGLAIVNNEHSSDRTKKRNPPRVGVLYTSAQTVKGRYIIAPWTFSTRAEAREVRKQEAKAWSFSPYVKIRVVKLRIEILEK